nr:auxin-induced protein 15A-like [Ipomoea batatas]GMD09821.1 auxin-induced protein 15A-like [Ipomoea batatas]
MQHTNVHPYSYAFRIFDDDSSANLYCVCKAFSEENELNLFGYGNHIMGINLMTVFHVAKYIVRSRSTTTTADVPRGHLAVYVGECPDERHRFVVPISYLNHPLFHDLLSLAEEEYGFRHPTGGLTIPCTEAAFLNIISHLQSQRSAANY